MVQVKEWMNTPVYSIDINSKAVDAARAMKKHKISAITVTRNNKAVGLISERDLVYKIMSLGKEPSKITIEKYISKKLVTAKQDTSVTEICRLMNSKKIKRVVIVKNQRPVGVITLSDVVRNLYG